jgi:C1A family cysteine protease
VEEVKAYPASVDLRGNDAPIFNQGGLGSCVAQAAVGIFEWLEKHVDSTKYFVGSRLAVYKWARDIDGHSGDVGTSCRTGAKTMAQYGVPHESLWPYNEGQYDAEPSQNVRDDAAQYKANSYWSISTGGDAYTSINDIKKALNTPLPVMFSFYVYSTYDDATNYGGHIGMPTGDPRGGHSNVIVGYNDATSNRDGSAGAFIVRNSWGTSWGASGYGYMPYNYASQNLINDAWVVAGESELVVTPDVTPVNPQPGPNNASEVHGFTGIDILPYLTKTHNGQPTTGYHEVVVYLPEAAGKASMNINVLVRELQAGRE